MLRGLTTVSYWADDVEAAKDWYARLLGVEPYFTVADPTTGKAAYYEFRIGDYQHELGLIDRRFAPEGAVAGPGGVVVYWHVDDIASTYETLLSLGATAHEPPTERGEGTGFVTATVVDPFGNVLGVMHNPHYVDIHRAMTAG